MNILIIEDIPADFRLLVRHLQQQGVAANCRCVSSRAELEAAFEGTWWDIVLADYNVPGMDFGDTLDFVQRRWPDVPVILLSGNMGEEQAVEMLKLGASDFVLKGKLARLVPAISRSLGEARQRQANRQANQEILRLNRLYAALCEINQAIVRAHSREELAGEVARVAVEIGGFKLAWVGQHHPQTLEVVPVASAGQPRDFVYQIPHTSRDGADHGCFCGRAIREGRSCIANDLSAVVGIREWQNATLQAGLRAAALLPIRVRGTIWGVLGVYSGDPAVFQEKEVSLLEKAALNIAYAIEHLEDEGRRQQAEIALLESHARLKKVLQVDAVGVMFWDLSTGCLVDANDTFLRLMGYSRQEVEARELTWQKLTPPEYLELSRAEVSRFLLTGRVGPYEKEYLRKDGTRQWLVFAGSSLGGNSCVEFCVDISDRKRVEAALRASEAEFRGMFELASVGMAQADPVTGRLLRVNRKLCEITGYAEAELLDMQVADITHPDDRGHSEEVFQSVRRGEAPAGRLEKRYLRKDGVVTWVNVNLTVLRDTAGVPLRMMATIEDITVRKQAEAERNRLVTAMEQAAETIMITDADGTILYVNPAFEKTAGYPRQEALGQNPRILKSGKHDAAFYRQLWATLRRGEVWHGRFINRRKDGKLFEEDATISPVREVSGRIVNFVGIKQDVTRQVQLEAQLIRAQRLESVGALASGIAHDLNNILSPILIIAPLVREHIADAETRALLDTVEASARRGADIIKQLLTFARGQPGQRVPVPLRHLLRDMEKIVRETFPRNIPPTVRVSHDLWSVMGDPTQLHQALLNLCVNARDAMPNGGTLRLEAKNTAVDEPAAAVTPDARPGPYVCVSVADAGTGIAPAHLERIFDPFFTTKDIGKGTGLGLSTVLGIVRGHEGFVRVISQVGQGTTFELYFPALPEPPAAPPEPPACAIPRGQGEWILVVDDETSVREGMLRMLERNGYRVLTACQGAEGLDTFSRHRGKIHAVVTDAMMPVMGGAAMVHAIRALAPTLPIMVMTGLAERETLESLEKLNAAMLLNKPFSGEELLETLAKALAGPPPPEAAPDHFQGPSDPTAHE